MKNNKFIIPFCCLLLWLSSETLNAQVVVVMNIKSPTVSLSKEQLKRIYLLDVTSLKTGINSNENIIVVDLKRKTDTTGKFYQTIIGLSHARVRLGWLGKILNGEVQSLPVKLSSDADVLRYVSENIGAIGFVKIASLDSNTALVKTIKIDGKNFKHPSYIIQ